MDPASEKQKHLVTFHNICVMAYADKEINDAEINLLAEMARGMGLEHGEFGDKIDNIADLKYIIPETESEKEHELRMVILTMITDGSIDPKEYESLMDFSQQMGIPKEYVDEVLDFYVKKQEARLVNLSLYQNLYLVAMADGSINEKERKLLIEAADALELMPSDTEYVEENEDDLELYIPDHEGERHALLQNLVYMMMVDGEMADSEYELCQKFAEAIGVEDAKISLIISEHEQMKAKREAELSEIVMYNTDIYLDVFNAFNRLPDTPQERAKRIVEMAQTRNFDQLPYESERHNKAFFDFLWLSHLRMADIDVKSLVKIPMFMDLISKQGNFRDLQNQMLTEERKYGTEEIDIEEKSIKHLQNDLSLFFDSFN